MIKKIEATVVEIKQLSHDTKSFRLKPTNGFDFKAGQFLMINFQKDNRPVRRPYSIASPPFQKDVEICLNYLPGGTASEFLFGLKGGERIEIDGPYGLFTVDDLERDKAFIAVGTGIAPIWGMIQDLLEKGFNKEIILIFGERTEEDILYRAEFEELAKKHKNFHYVVTLTRAEPEWKGERGRVQQVMKKYINTEMEAYICGLKDMVDDVKADLLEMGFEPRSIHHEKFV